MGILKNAAVSMCRAGLCILPADLTQKRPAVSNWGRFRATPPSITQTGEMFDAANIDAVCIVTGAASGQCEAIDFDLAGEMFAPFCDVVTGLAPDLLERCVIERSPSGGYHVFYLRMSATPGNHKLATRTVPVTGPGDHEYRGKKYAARKSGDAWLIFVTMIETRGEGGIILCSPSPGYEILEGFFEALPLLNAREVKILEMAARALDETAPAAHRDAPDAPDNAGATNTPPAQTTRASGPRNAASGPAAMRPGDDFNQRGDPRPFLLAAGWVLVRPGDNEQWRRPGKPDGVSATLKDGVFYVFSSNAAPFEPETAYSPYHVFALLEHGGNWQRASRALRVAGFGGELPQQADDFPGVDISGLDAPPQPRAELIPAAHDDDGETDDEVENPGLLPDDLIDVPGFVNGMIDYCLENAPQPNVIQSLAGALAFQAFLCGRKVRDPMDIRTNLYILGLAHSASGKDFPRQLNFRMAQQAGFTGGEIAGRFASGEGVEDALLATPCMLFQTDEIDGMLAGIGRNRTEGKTDSMMMTLLSIYTSASGIHPMRRRAASAENNANGQTIDQPCMVLYGSAIPNHYYNAISERMLTNGFFARCIVLESGVRGEGRDLDEIRPVPAELVAVARWWREHAPGAGNLSHLHPQPRTVAYEPEALEIMRGCRKLAGDQCRDAEIAGDSVRTSVWGRVHEHARKLALIYACSENANDPKITQKAAEWGTRFATHQVQRSLWMAAQHVADSDFEALALKITRKLRENGGRLAHGILLKSAKIDAKTFAETITTLMERGDISREQSATNGRNAVFYSLI